MPLMKRGATSANSAPSRSTQSTRFSLTCPSASTTGAVLFVRFGMSPAPSGHRFPVGPTRRYTTNAACLDQSDRSDGLPVEELPHVHATPLAHRRLIDRETGGDVLHRAAHRL